MRGAVAAFAAIVLMSAFSGSAAQSQNLILDSPGRASLPQQLEKLPDTAKPYFTYKAYPGPVEDIQALANNPAPTATIPLASFSVKASKDGKTYTDVIVGRSPGALPHETTHVNVLIVPVVLTIETSAGNVVFSTLAANSCGTSKGHTDYANFLDSPIIKPVTFDGSTAAGHAAKINGINMGVGTYNDEFRRAEFFKFMGGAASAYHTVFNLSAEGISFSATSSVATISGSGCGRLGLVNYQALDPFIQSTLLPFVKATPSTFVVFLFHDVVLFDGSLSNCCILGYHGAESNKQTYGVVDYDTSGRFSNVTDTSVAAHEVGEWLDDPFGNNPTPAWGKIGQVSGCQGNWEVGDPLSGTLFPKILATNGVTFSAQELAFWGWYYSKDHDSTFQSVGAGDVFSNHDTFKGPSKACPPGGTFPN